MKKSVFRWFLVLLATAVFIVACPDVSDDGVTGGEDNGTGGDTGDSISLLLAGRGQDGEGDGYPFYATVNLAANLSASTVVGTPVIVVLDDAPHAYATGIAQTDNGVVVAGYSYDDSYRETPCFWMDGTRTDLPLPVGDSWRGAALSIDGSGRYIGGYAWNSVTLEYLPVFWDNGELHVLTNIPDESMYAAVYAIRSAEGDGLYLAGVHCSAEWVDTPCYWHMALDGTESRVDLPMPDGVTDAGVGGIALNDGVVHVSGKHGSAYKDGETVCCWSNGIRTDLATSGAASASGVACGGDRILVAGMIADWGDGWPVNFRARLWNGGYPFALSDIDSWAQCVCVVGTQVVVAGWSGEYGSAMEATIWLVSGLMEPSVASQQVHSSALVTIDTTIVDDTDFHLREFVAMAESGN